MSKEKYQQTTGGQIFHSSYIFSDAVIISEAKGRELFKHQNINELLKIVAPKQTIFTIVKHVSSSGMSRDIGVYIVNAGKIQDISFYISNILGWKRSKNGGVRVSGCGMDMGFHLVYTLGAILWPNGTIEAHGTRNGKPDADGGYALTHEWI